MPTAHISKILAASDASDLNDEQVRYIRDNPDVLDLIGDRETLQVRTLWRVLWLAVLLVGLSKIISVTHGDELDQFIIRVTSDLVFEMGAALIGSIATVIFIEHQQKKQFEENLSFRSAIQRRIESLEPSNGID